MADINIKIHPSSDIGISLNESEDIAVKMQPPSDIAINIPSDIAPIIGLNGGGGSDSDWINPTSGLAKLWQFTGPSTAEIVTGNGFSGNAQKVSQLGGGGAVGSGIQIPLDADGAAVLTSGSAYKITFKYRKKTGSPDIITTSLAGDPVITAVDNEGNASEVSVIGYADQTYLNMLFTSNLADIWMEVDEVVVSELTNVITNGTFDADTDWAKGAGWTITGGKAVGTAAIGNLTQVGILTVGVFYEITYTISDYSGGSVRVYSGLKAGTIRSANGTYTEILECTVGTNFAFDGVTAFTGKIDNVIATPQ